MPANETMDYYNAVAEEYEYFYRDDWEAAMQLTVLISRRRCLRIVRVAIKRVLNACGTGAQSIALAKLGYEVTAMDEPQHAAQARRATLKYNVGDKISMRQANFVNYRVPSGPFRRCYWGRCHICAGTIGYRRRSATSITCCARRSWW
ncbi:MAG: hypothetical protein U0528_16090 [Anaerolineae bacterium]